MQQSTLAFDEHNLLGEKVQNGFILLLLNKATCKFKAALHALSICCVVAKGIVVYQHFIHSNQILSKRFAVIIAYLK